jgi:hypothetical protein
MICNENTGKCIIKPKETKQPKTNNDNDNDCRTNPNKCVEMGIEKGKEMICNDNTGRCITKPKVKKKLVIKK